MHGAGKNMALTWVGGSGIRPWQVARQSYEVGSILPCPGAIESLETARKLVPDHDAVYVHESAACRTYASAGEVSDTDRR